MWEQPVLAGSKEKHIVWLTTRKYCAPAMQTCAYGKTSSRFASMARQAMPKDWNTTALCINEWSVEKLLNLWGNELGRYIAKLSHARG